jgi:NADPH:quinone reductase-like Zn-dependent oxidoreductase
MVERFGATAIDYRAGDFVAAVRGLTAGRKGGVGVDAAFDAIAGAHFARPSAKVWNWHFSDQAALSV